MASTFGGGIYNPGGGTAEASELQVGTRINRITATQLGLVAAIGDLIYVNGQWLDKDNIAACNTSDNLIDANGADAGATPSANTVYSVYVSNGNASFAASSLRLSATPPNVNSFGTPYLNSSGNGLNWRFLGLARLDGSVNFNNSLTAREVWNLYNQKPLALFTCPNYANDNAQTTYNLAASTTVWTPINGGTGDNVSFLTGIISSPGNFSPLVNPVDLYAQMITTSAATVLVAVGIQVGLSGTGPVITGTHSNNQRNQYCEKSFSPSSTYENYSLVALDPGLVAAVILADDGRSGSTTDVPMTFLSGTVYA